MTEIEFKQYLREFREYRWTEDEMVEKAKQLSSASNGAKPIVSGALPLTENDYLKNKVKELLLFVESDGWVVNGFRTLEIVQELKKLCGNDR